MGVWDRASGIISPETAGDTISIANNIIFNQNGRGVLESLSLLDAIGTTLINAAQITTRRTIVTPTGVSDIAVKLPINPTPGAIYIVMNISDLYVVKCFPGQASDSFDYTWTLPGDSVNVDYLVGLCALALTSTLWTVVNWE